MKDATLQALMSQAQKLIDSAKHRSVELDSQHEEDTRLLADCAQVIEWQAERLEQFRVMQVALLADIRSLRDSCVDILAGLLPSDDSGENGADERRMAARVANIVERIRS